ncbi:unnamed protein product [Ixodes hexagonus]
MLSPVPFRICCIAAMAPALTEAASQAESFSLPHSPASSSVCGSNPASPPAERLVNGRTLLPRRFRDHRLLWDGASLAAFANVKLLRLREQGAPPDARMNGQAHAAAMGLTNGSAHMAPPDKSWPDPAAGPAHRPKPRGGGGGPRGVPSGPPQPPRVPRHDPVDIADQPTGQASLLELLERARTRKSSLERRSERLHRRVRKLQLRQAVQHASGQMSAFFEHQQTTLGLPCLMPQRLLHRKLRDSADLKAELLLQSEDVKSLSTAALVSLVRKLEESSSQGAQTTGQGQPPDLRLTEEDRLESERVAGTLRSTLAHQERAVDSDATESSSGGESGDELDPWDQRAGVSAAASSSDGAASVAALAPTNTTTAATTTAAGATLPGGVTPTRKSSIRHSGAWRWALERAAVASRWTWLQAQVADLEFRIRQQSDLCRQLRRAKGPLRLEGADGDSSTPTDTTSTSTTTTIPPHLQNTTTPHCEHNSTTTGDPCSCKLGAATSTTTTAPPSKPNGLVLPSSQDVPGTTAGGGCVRTRALAAGFRKRKVVLAASALASARKSARLSATVQCSCRSVCGPSSSPAGWGSSAQLPGLQATPTPTPLQGHLVDVSPEFVPGGGVAPPSSCPGEPPSAVYPPLSPCLVCAGRYNSVRPLDADLMTRQERAALLDPGFHPVLSFRSDIPQNLHFEMLLRTGELQKLALRASATLRKKSRLAQVSGLTVDQARKKSRKLARNAAQSLLSSAKMRRHHGEKRPYRRHMDGEVTIDETCVDGHFRRSDGSYSLMSMKQRERQRSISTASSGSSKAASPVPSPAPSLGDNSQLPGGAQNRSILQEVLRRRRGENAFDINNIVIPYSIASATRVERLPYKEILTPKWRVLSEEELNGTTQELAEVKEEVEDIADETFQARHRVCEEEERKRFAGLLSKAALGAAKAAQAHQTQPHQQEPHPDQTQQQQQPDPHQQQPLTPDPYDGEVPPLSPPSAWAQLGTWAFCCDMEPYEPRSFPLADAEFEAMLANSLHLLPSPPASPAREAGSESESAEPVAETTMEPAAVEPEPDSPVSSESSAPLVTDDPNDPEWTVVASEQKQNLVLKLTKR